MTTIMYVTTTIRLTRMVTAGPHHDMEKYKTTTTTTTTTTGIILVEWKQTKKIDLHH